MLTEPNKAKHTWLGQDDLSDVLEAEKPLSHVDLLLYLPIEYH